MYSLIYITINEYLMTLLIDIEPISSKQLRKHSFINVDYLLNY